MPVPIGEPLPLNDFDLDKEAEITGEDIAKAKKLWREFAPVPLKDLLDAIPVNETGNPA